jgi:hypothetical protein
MLNDSYAKFYSPSEHLPVGASVLFKGTVIFKQYIPKKHKEFGTRIYSLCKLTGHTYDISIYVGNDGKMQHR